MPVILAADALAPRVDPATPADRLVTLLAPAADDLLETVAVSRLVSHMFRRAQVGTGAVVPRREAGDRPSGRAAGPGPGQLAWSDRDTEAGELAEERRAGVCRTSHRGTIGVNPASNRK